MCSGVTPSHRAVWCEELGWLHAEANKDTCIWVLMFQTDKDDKDCATVNDPESTTTPAPKARNGRRLTKRGSGTSKGALLQALAAIQDPSIEEEDEVDDDDVRVVVGQPRVRGRNADSARRARLRGGLYASAAVKHKSTVVKKEKRPRSKSRSLEAATSYGDSDDDQSWSASEGQDDGSTSDEDGSEDGEVKDDKVDEKVDEGDEEGIEGDEEDDEGDEGGDEGGLSDGDVDDDEVDDDVDGEDDEAGYTGDENGDEEVDESGDEVGESDAED